MSRRLGLAGLLLWAAGVQCSEALASAGLLLSVLAAVPPIAAAGWRDAARAWWPVLLFVGWCSLVPLLGGHPPTGAGQARLLDWLGLPAASLCLAPLDHRERCLLFRVAAAVLVLSCAVALAQHLGWWPPLEWFSGLRWTRIPFHRVYEPAPGPPGRFMAGGLLFHRLEFAAVSGLVVLWCASTALVRKSRVAGVVAVLGTLAIAFFPHARAAAGALAVGLVAAVLLAFPRRRAAAIATLGVLVVGVALVGPVRARLVAFATERPDGSRTALLRTGLRATASHPWTGVGLGRFHPGPFADAQTPEEVRQHRGKSHDQWVTLAAEAGVPGALLFLLLLAAAFLAPAGDDLSRVARRAVLVFFAALCLLHDPLFHAVTSMATVLAIGLGLTPGTGLRPSLRRGRAAATSTAPDEPS